MRAWGVGLGAWSWDSGKKKPESGEVGDWGDRRRGLRLRSATVDAGKLTVPAQSITT